MTKEEYFGSWLQVLPEKEMSDILKKLWPIRDRICPAYKDIFKAFHKCPYEDLKLVVVGMGPYPQKGIATGIAFANDSKTLDEDLSPSLQVIKESVINYEIPHNFITFAPDLEYWEEQGVLLINSAFTCLAGQTGSHSNLWRPFVSKLVSNICEYNPGTVFLLLGSQADTFTPYISKFCHIIKEKHPSYYARTNTKMPYEVWTRVKDMLMKYYGYKINFYKEISYD